MTSPRMPRPLALALPLLALPLSPGRAGAADFWQAWADNHALFPCGVDVVFAAGSQLLALPRSIAVEG